MQKLQVFRISQVRAFFARSYKQTTVIIHASKVFCKVNLKKKHYLTLRKSTKALPQLLSLQTFSGSWDSTSFFSLLSKKGRSTLWRRRMIRIVSSSFKSTLSPVMANGALNHCSKVLQLLKIVGSRKLRRAHSSGNLFCNGVPVSSIRLGAT